MSQTLTSCTVKPAEDDLRTLKQLIEAGAVTPLTDRSYALSEVAEALGYLEQGYARGKVVVTV